MEKAKTEQILEQLCQKIGGDWLLVGGTLVQLCYDGGRSTEDIDLVQIAHPSRSKESLQDELFRFTLNTWQMGPEYINLSADFFVRDLKGWESELLLMKHGPVGRIFRPSITLFAALKLRRASELDINDIKAALTKEGSAHLDFEKLNFWLSPKKIELLKSIITASTSTSG